MKISDIKATFYDLVSYLFSGILFLITIYIARCHLENNTFYLSAIKEMDASAILIILFGSYIVGHLVSSTSSALIEKWLLKDKINNLNPLTLLTEQLHHLFIQKYKNLFQSDYMDKDFRLLVCYVESYQPNIYNTAFVFLSIYGMCRNFSLIFILSSIVEIILLIKSWNVIYFAFVVLYILSSLVFLYGYYRFYKYFKHEVICGFLLSGE